MTPAEQQLRDAVAALLEIPDPATRAQAITGVIKDFPELSQQLRASRQEAVNTLRQTMSLAEIGKLIGVAKNRVQQISEGRSQGKRADERPAVESPPELTE